MIKSPNAPIPVYLLRIRLFIFPGSWSYRLVCELVVVVGILISASCFGQSSRAFEEAFVNFETAPVHPIALSPDLTKLAVCNLADARLELFDIASGDLIPAGTVPVGLDPVSVRFRNNSEAWVVNHISDSISIIDLPTLQVAATINTLDTPADVVFAGSPTRAFVSCAMPNTIQVFDPQTRQLVTNILVNAERPKALATSPDGSKVYAAIFESGNGTTLIGPKFRNMLFFGNAVSVTNGPYSGQNPPPNFGESFLPALNPGLPTNLPPPATGIIVRKNSSGRWLDDNQRDWTEFVSGTNAHLTQRVAGWDLPDRDLAIIDAASNSVTYATGLMNICMTLGVHPVSGRVCVVGTDSINEVRFEPNLNGIFVRVKAALVDPLTLSKAVHDLNPHLDYTSGFSQQRAQSIGDPRALVWTSDGSRAYVAGMGSGNVIMLDTSGNRAPVAPIEVGEGPCGLALDESRQRLYVFNRFSSSVSVIDLGAAVVLNAVPLFDPTPVAVAAGRKHLYDTRQRSGLGQASCASCHVDARMDRLGWDLGNPAGPMIETAVNHQGLLATNRFHPMKGVMVTQTLQDIIGHEPFHWRGDQPSIESFNATFTNLQGAAVGLSTAEMREFRDFLASIRFPPNPFRNFDNSLSTNVPLPGHMALGEDRLPFGAALGPGNAVDGRRAFNEQGNFCVNCHTLSTGLGIDIPSLPVGTNGEHHLTLATRLEGPLLSKVSQFQNMADKIGMNGAQLESRAGFGFGHDGSVDTMTRFLNGVRIIADRDVADLIAFLLSVSGVDPEDSETLPGRSLPAAVGRQITLSSPSATPMLEAMIALARSTNSRVALIAKGLGRGWHYDESREIFQSDREIETASLNHLVALASTGTEVTFTVVPRELGIRLGVDRDLDGVFDRDELDAGTDPAERQLLPRIVTAATELAVGSDLLLEAQIPPLPAGLRYIIWRKENQPLPAATNRTLTLTNVGFAASGDYTVVVTTPFTTWTSAPVRIVVSPLLVTVTPASASVWLGSNTTFTSAVIGPGPFAYQWRFNGQPLADIVSNTLILTNAQLINEGWYDVVAANAFGVVTSAPVRLGLLIRPTIVLPPLSQRVVAGGNATFSLAIAGHPPPFRYELRRGSATLTRTTTDQRMAFLTLSNVQPSNAASYRIIVTNAATSPFVITLDPVTLTVLADTDADGLPDEWEATHGLQTNNIADARDDSDFDGLLNWQEYAAGTHPGNLQDFLRIGHIALVQDQRVAVLQFNARSNKTYTLRYRDSLDASRWMRLTDFVALPTNSVMSFTNAADGSRARYYHLVTPRMP